MPLVLVLPPKHLPGDTPRRVGFAYDTTLRWNLLDARLLKKGHLVSVLTSKSGPQ